MNFNHRNKHIVAYELITRNVTDYNTICEAERDLGISYKMIQRILRGEKFSFAGYTFTYSDRIDELESKALGENHRASTYDYGRKSVTAIHVSNREKFTFESIRDASAQLGVSRPTIIKHITDGRACNKGYRFIRKP